LFIPDLIQENYLKSIPSNDVMENISKAADAISFGDLVEQQVRGVSQNWSLCGFHGFTSTVLPTHYVKGRLSGRLDFSSWLGNFSKENKYQRILKDLTMHMRLHVSADKFEVRQSYLPVLLDKLYNPLLTKGQVK
jgi:replication factor C subunit 1